MNVLVIDGQGGGLGRQLITEIKNTCPGVEITAVGTNVLATNNMIKAEADQAATGENSIKVACKKADVIVGAIGIVIADSMLGEITAEIARTVGSADAKRVLIPVNICDNIVVGVNDQSMSKLVKSAANYVKELYDSGLKG